MTKIKIDIKRPRSQVRENQKKRRIRIKIVKKRTVMKTVTVTAIKMMMKVMRKRTMR